MIRTPVGSGRAQARPRKITAIAVALLVGAGGASTARAQTDYYNTDAGRPIRIEDAYAIERRAFELQVAPIRLERGARGQYHWSIEPEIAYGLFPRTQLEVGFPITWLDGASERSARLSRIEVSLLHNLNAETRIPALAVAAEVLVPVGSGASDEVHTSLKGIATKTFRFARFHVNGQYTLGDAPVAAPSTPASAQVEEASRWMSGVAVDRAFPLRALLVTGEVFAQGALAEGSETEWNATVGSRMQLSPRWALDAGIGRKLNGDDRTWSFTMGGAVAFGLPWSR